MHILMGKCVGGVFKVDLNVHMAIGYTLQTT
jgi:hypothetical protein